MAMRRSSFNMYATFALWSTLLFLSPLTTNAAMYIFGDSLYDTGMTLYNGVKGAGAEFWPYGETYFKKPSGRYCDGRVIPDFLGQFANLGLPKPYLLPGLNDYTKAINFASAAACVLVETRPNTINLKLQVNYFGQMVQKMERQLGKSQAWNVLSKAVYVFNIAGNDYTTVVKNNVNKPALTTAYKNQYINKVIDNLTNDIKTLYNQGARKFAFQNIGPAGCLPAMRNADASCNREIQHLVQMHNSRFLAKLKQLQSQWPGFKYTVYDFYTSLTTRIVRGSAYGFKVTNSACCGSGPLNGLFTCQKKGTGFKVCSNPNDYLFFDAGHTTEKANQKFAQEFWSGSNRLVSPYNLKTLISM